MGTTVRVASMRDDGHTFHDSRTPDMTLSTLYLRRSSDMLTVALLDIFEVHHDKDVVVENERSVRKLWDVCPGSRQSACLWLLLSAFRYRPRWMKISQST